MVDKTKIYEGIACDSEKSMHPGGIELTEKIIEKSRLIEGRILDIGCGKGESIKLLKEKGFKSYGVDISEKFIEENKKNISGVEFLNLDLNKTLKLPYDDNFFDGVLVECVLNLLEDREAIVKEIYRILKKNGKLLINDLMTLEKNNMANLWTQNNWEKIVLNNNFNLIYMKEERAILNSFILKSIWEDKGICKTICVPKGANINNMSYISLIGKK